MPDGTIYDPRITPVMLHNATGGNDDAPSTRAVAMPHLPLHVTRYFGQEIVRLREIERCARGVVRTAHPNVAEHMVADGWWNALVEALATEEES